MLIATTDWWLVGANIAVAIGTLFLGAMAYKSIRSNERVIREQNRPYLSLMYEQFEGLLGKVTIPLCNTGRTAAIDAHVTATNLEGIHIKKIFNYIPPGGSVPMIFGKIGTVIIDVSYLPEWCDIQPNPYTHQWKIDISESRLNLIGD